MVRSPSSTWPVRIWPGAVFSPPAGRRNASNSSAVAGWTRGTPVVEAVQAAQVKPSVVIQSSGIGYYGTRGDSVRTEADGPGADFLARLTVDWEASTAPVALQSVRHVSIRSGVVLSPTEGALYRLLLPFKLFVGGPMGSGRQGFSWIHPADETAAIGFLIENSGASGVFNLRAAKPLTNVAFAKVIGAVLGRPSWLPAPAFALKLALGEVASIGAGGTAGDTAEAARPGLQVSLPRR